MLQAFSHSGKIGDLIYSLNFCKEYSKLRGEDKFDLHIQTNQKHVDSTFERSNIMLSEKAAEFIRPLLEKQRFIGNVTIGDKIPDDYFDLSIIRKVIKGWGSGDLRLLYYDLCEEYISEDLSIPLFEAEIDDLLKDKVILMLSERYVPYELDFRQLEQFKENLVFIGLSDEHKSFCERWFQIDYHPVKDAYELACLMKGCKGVISNLNGNYAIAEQLKVPRVLLWPDIMKIEYSKKKKLIGQPVIGPMNVVPQGGWFATACKNPRMVGIVKELLN